MAAKLVNLRIFPDSAGNMNRSILDTGGGVLAVSQFTLHADCSRGRRPGFAGARTRRRPPPSSMSSWRG